MGDKPEFQLVIRSAQQADVGLVISSWKSSHRKTTRWLPQDIHDRAMHSAILDALKTACVWVASNPQDEGHLYGWACAEPFRSPPLLHYVFVKSKFRGLGIADRLICEAGKEVSRKMVATAWTLDGRKLLTHDLVSGLRPDYFHCGE